MYRDQIVWFLIVVIGLCDSPKLNISGCVKGCKDQLSKYYGYVCDMRCLQDTLGELVEKDYKRTLQKPAEPSLVDAGWQTIQLSFNTTELEKYSDLYYILEVKPQWGLQERNNLFVVFPYTRKYHYTNETTYAVKDLEPNTGYKFRVIAIQLNKSSPYSNWSNVFNTTKTCKKLPCGVTNIRLELRTQKPYQKYEELKSKFHWKPALLSETDKTQLKYITQKLSSLARNGNCDPGEYPMAERHTAITSNSSDENQNVYYDCWYELKMTAADDYFFPTNVAGERTRIFYVPKCILINDDEICGCPSLDEGTSHRKDSINARFTRNTRNNNRVTMFLNWTDVTWKNAEKITYFKVQIRNGGSLIFKEYVRAFSNVSRYSKTIFNLTYGTNYYLSIYGYHGDHCLSKYVEALDVTAIPACENANCTMRKPNSTCQPDGYHGKHNCICDYGFFNENNKCIDKDPCQRNTCAENQKCTPIVATGGHNCTCQKNFIEKNGTCKPVDPCGTNPCGVDHNCTPIVATGKHNCICKENFIEKNGTCEKVPPETKYYSVTNNSKGVIVAAVLVPSLVILVAILIIIWLRKRHEKRMDFMEREMAIAFDVGSRSNPRRFTNKDNLEDDNGERIVNLIYVSQDNVYGTPGYIVDKICSFEMPVDSIRFGGIIGRGEFGKVYVGEAQGVNRNPEWTTVAIKIFKESVNEEEYSEILREIELMTDLGKHENVIQMFGCCTICRPICLILEYAPGGNLKMYLRSLKKKCKDIASKRIVDVTESSKEGYRKLIEAGKMPNDSISSILGNASERYKLEEAGLKQTGDLNIEIASRINEEIRFALDPKELESFARQIATGMKHVSGLSIVHRDLAARNILLGEGKVLKISDFGLSREEAYIKKSNGKIPFRWLSIEAIQERVYSTASDVWAFGVVLWEICTLGDTPYPSVSDRDLKDFLLSGKRLEKVGSCTDDIYEIMVRCWSHLPKDRPTFAELSDRLWNLEHNEKSYVNLDSIMQQFIESEDYEDQDEQLNQENNDFGDGCDEQLLWNGIPTNKVSIDMFFGDRREDMNANAQQEQPV